MKPILRSFMLALSLAYTPVYAEEQKIVNGLIKDPGWELVMGHCSGCHSLKLVTSNRGNRETWLGMIRWMQETQKLWQFNEKTEDTILTYLSKNYGPAISSRRPPLAPHLLPE